MQRLAGDGRPAICEMGGKNPAYVSESADLDQAAEGVARAAFGYSGQKCSACSRTFVHRGRYEEFRARLIAKVADLTVGDPADDSFTGPLINTASLERFERTVQTIETSDGRVLTGGHRLVDNGLDAGAYASLTVVEADRSSEVWTKELFMPLVAIAPVDGLDEAIVRANETDYGLTAGIYSRDDAEVERYFDEVEASVVYEIDEAGPRLAPGPACSQLVAGRPRAALGKEPEGLTTCNSTCASRVAHGSRLERR